MTLAAHLWTVLPRLAAGVRPQTPPPSTPWSETLDGELGAVTLAGHLAEPEGARELILIVHGLGGCAASDYAVGASLAAQRAGVASLRVSLRGADGNGDDLYHAGLDGDLAWILARPSLARFVRVYLFGYSLGGHMALGAATRDDVDPRLAAVVAVCAPLDLAIAQQGIDAPAAKIYRHYILRHLRTLYARVAARHGTRLAGDPSAVAAARTLRAFDTAAVVPRFGFADADDYYRRASVAGRLGGLRVPARLVAVEDDPMVPSASIREAAASAPQLDLRWLPQGGHVHVPATVDLGDRPPGRLEDQLIAWLRAA